MGHLPELTRRRIGRALWICGAVGIAVATLTPSSGRLAGRAGLCIVCGEFGGLDALLNVALFLPVGMGLAMAQVRAARAIPAMCFATLAIESLQYAVIPGRDASVGDVLTNAVGGALGYLIGANLDRLIHPTRRSAYALTGAWLCVWLSVQAIAGFALAPRPTDSRYFGQIARALGGRPPYSGEVVAATLNGAAIPNEQFASAAPARDALAQSRDAEIRVALVPHGLESASIVRIADGQQREILLVASHQSDLILAWRTGASILRLRPVRYALRNAFSQMPAADHGTGRDTVRLRAVINTKRVVMSVDSRGATRNTSVDLTTSKAWLLVAPITVFADGSEAQSVLDAVWVLIWLVPAGVWGILSIRTESRRHDSWSVTVAVALALAGGFALGPAVFHLSVSPPTELAGAGAGLAVGVALGALAARSRARMPAANAPAA